MARLAAPTSPPAGIILVAAGQGRRLGGRLPKAWVGLAGRPLFLYSLERFHDLAWVKRIVLVMHPGCLGSARRLVSELGLKKVSAVVPGGKRRQDSVAMGARALSLGGIKVVLVHDIARPFVSGAIALKVARAAIEAGAALAAVPVSDTVKKAGPKDLVVSTLPRSGLWLAQTPQGIRTDLVPAWRRALLAGDSTDDVKPLEEAGLKVKLVAGSARLAKITLPEDLRIAGALMGSEVRAGFGFDVHRLVPGRPLVLAGLRISFNRGLEGHSDADIVSHALTDSLLGAVAGGDMGTRFGVRRKAAAGARSLDLLAGTARDLFARGWRVANADVTLLAQSPRLNPYRDRMIANLARALKTAPGEVSLKGTTAKGMGLIGRSEAMACFALTVLRKPL